MNTRSGQEILIDARPLSPWRLMPDLYRYRDLLFVIAQREIQVRYTQTTLGVLWALIQPLGAMCLAWFVFGRIANLSTESVPYPLFCLVGTQVWTYFSTGFANSSQSILSHSNIIGKLYFPRIILPLAIVVSGLMDLAIGLGFLAACLLWFGYVPTIVGAGLLPFIVLGLVVFTSGAGILGAALCARYRDLRHVIPFTIQMGFFVTPIVYSTSVLPASYAPLLKLNPLAGYIDTLRAVAFRAPIPWEAFLGALWSSLLLWTVAVWLFQKIEHTMADTI